MLGQPGPRAATKERTRLHTMDRAWLAASPFCVIATAAADGTCDASPKGDPGGNLIHVLRDAPFFDDLVVKGHRPLLALLVEIDQIFFHCAKAFLRSRLWNPDTWEPETLPSHATMVKCVQDTPETLEELERHYSPAHYEALLYQQ
jgi:predicted pyridoxine 5'-phosphate oxidase superfamily flavin-nucleotide-binding protein